MGSGRGQRGISEELVMLFIDVHMGTWKFSVCKNSIKLGMSVRVLMHRDFVDLFAMQLTIRLKKIAAVVLLIILNLTTVFLLQRTGLS